MKKLLYSALFGLALSVGLAQAQLLKPAHAWPGTPVGVPHLAGAGPAQLAKELDESAAYLVSLQKYHAALAEIGGDEARQKMTQAAGWYNRERAWVVSAAAQVQDWAARTAIDGSVSDKLKDAGRKIDEGGKDADQRFRDPHE